MARYAIVPDRSKVWIEARSSVHPIHTETDGLEGWLEIDGDRLVDGRLSLAVERLRSGNPLQDRELRRRIDAKRHPTIDGVASSITGGTDQGAVVVEGDLTFHGTTKRFDGDMRLEWLDGKAVRLTGEAHFDVRDFGMEPPKILMLKVEPVVGVRVEVIATQK